MLFFTNCRLGYWGTAIGERTWALKPHLIPGTPE